ncbi:class I SAM-dependent methyltransferase [Marilutibacter alkalisoli]|nr:class I SAM-dependent methyltransferase [Lysobacter alkalisoli]
MAQYQSFPDAAGDSLTLDKLKALRLPGLSGKAFLDVGCNEGFFCGFARFQGAARVVGIDHSAQFIKRARKRFPDCEFHCQGWETLPDGEFDVILLASALHYAEDQPALIQALVNKLSRDGVLVLELGIVSVRKAAWERVKRGIDERLFPSMAMLRQVLAGYAWKWMGPSVSQQGDPVARHVVHISRRRPVAYLLMQPPGYGKSSIAAGLFAPAGVPVISGDHQVALVGKGRIEASEPLRKTIAEDYSPFELDRIIRAVFEQGMGPELVDIWLVGAGEGDVAIDVYVPPEHHDSVERLLQARGYLPVRLGWERVGAAPMPDEALAQYSEAFYLSMLQPASGVVADEKTRRFEPAGFVDEISVEAGSLIIRGWAIDKRGVLPERMGAKLGRRSLQVTAVEKQMRPDVQKHLGLPHALVGYRMSLVAPKVLTASDVGGLQVCVPGGITFTLAGSIDSIFRGVAP